MKSRTSSMALQLRPSSKFTIQAHEDMYASAFLLIESTLSYIHTSLLHRLLFAGKS
jgi:hypothetical protein